MEFSLPVLLFFIKIFWQKGMKKSWRTLKIFFFFFSFFFCKLCIATDFFSGSCVGVFIIATLECLFQNWLFFMYCRILIPCPICLLKVYISHALRKKYSTFTLMFVFIFLHMSYFKWHVSFPKCSCSATLPNKENILIISLEKMDIIGGKL